MSTGEICWCGGSVYPEGEGDTLTMRCASSEFHDPLATGKTTKIKKLYVAGPMSGKEDCNYPVFNGVAEALRYCGFEVVNPAEYGDLGSHYVDLLREDLRRLLDCDGVAVLGDWWESTGARNEVMVAGLLKMPVRTWTEWVNIASRWQT